MVGTREPAGRYVDPAIAGLVALVVYALHGLEGSLDRDPATFVYGGVRFAHGVPPYQGIFNSVGPLGDMVSGVGTRIGWLFGLDDLTGARLVYLVLSAACVSGVCVLARAVLHSRTGGLLAAAVYLTFAGFLRLATEGPREKTVMVLCLQVALVLLLSRRWVWAGVLTALATLTWQPVLLPLVAAAVGAVLTSGSPRLRATLRFVLGGLVPTAVLAAYFLLEGAFRDAYWGFVRVNIGYTSQPDIVETWPTLVHEYGWSLALVVAGWVSAVALGLLALVRWRRADGDHEGARGPLVLGTGAVVAGLWSCYAINGGPDLFVVLPFAATGLAGGLVLLGSRLPSRSARVVLAAVAVLAVLAAGAESVTTRNSELLTQRRDVTRMLAATPPHSTVLSVSAPEVLVLAHRRNPYGWQLSNDAISHFLDDHLPGGLAAYADRVSRLHPALVAVGLHTSDDWLQPVLTREYTRVGRGDHWVWYAADTLGAQRLRTLRRLNHETWDDRWARP